MNVCKRVCIVWLAVVLVLVGSLGTSELTTQAASSNQGSAVSLTPGNEVQERFQDGFSTHWYKIIPSTTQYYRFTFKNQSAEVRTGISIADSMLNLFLGSMEVTIYDAYDTILAEGSIRCGYQGSVSLKLTQGNTYYIKLYSTVDGNYNIQTTAIADIGADSWGAATMVGATEQMVSALEASGDEDWFCFMADAERSYYDFSLENISGTGDMYFALYEYVEGAGETPLRDVCSARASRGNTCNEVVQLKEGATYYYKIYGSSGVTGGYLWDVKQTIDAVGNTVEEAYSIDLDTKITTSFEGEGDRYASNQDVDYVRFTTAEENAYYHIAFESLSVSYVELYVYDEAGNLIEDDYKTSTGKMSTLTLLLKPDATYYLKMLGTYGNYVFSVTKNTDVYYGDKEQATAISLNQEYTSSFDGNGDRYSGWKDTDYVKFTTDGDNAYYHIAYESLGVSYVELYVYDEAGNLIEDDYKTSTGKMSTLTLLLKPDATYYLKMLGTYGNYVFSVMKKTDVYYGDKEQATAISLNQEYTSSLDGNGDRYSGWKDTDYVKFTTTGEHAYYHIAYESLSVSYVELYVYDEAGNLIEDDYKTSTGKMSTIALLLEPNSVYYIRMTGTYGNYKLSVSTEVDYEGNSKDEAASLAVNELYEARLEADNDVDWYVVQIKEDGFYRIRIINESCRDVDCAVYSARDREVMSYSDDTAELSTGTYYIKVDGYQGYYSVVLADCGSGHIEKEKYTVQATTSSDGSKKVYCASCEKTIKTEKVRKIDSITISASKFTCNGKTQRPTITVKDSYGSKVTSYSVKWSNANSKLPGKYTVTITFKGAYKGSKTFTYYLNLGKAKVKAKKSGKKINVAWSGAAGANKFEVYRREYNAKKKKWGAWKKVKTTSAKKYVDKKAKKGKYYQYYVKASYGSYTSKSASTKKVKR